MEEQNASLLSSVEQTTQAQVNIQKAVECFHGMAINYDAVRLLKVGIESLASIGIDSHYLKPILLLSIPLIFVSVWQAVRHDLRQ